MHADPVPRGLCLYEQYHCCVLDQLAGRILQELLTADSQKHKSRPLDEANFAREQRSPCPCFSA